MGDVLILNSQVGGLGLNLTAADTVVFLEHDWNPIKDIQAMDRTHRFGQQQTVNVYRVLTRNTIEERIMSLQSLKINLANAIIDKNNMKLNSMEISQIINFFR